MNCRLYKLRPDHLLHLLYLPMGLYTDGENYNGQLGDGKSVNKKTPSKIGTGYTAIAAGFCHNLFLKGNVLYSSGYNEDGQLGNGTRKNSLSQVKIGTGYTAIAAGGFHSLALKGNALYAWGSNYYGQLGDGTNTDRTKPVLIGTGYTAIAAGWYYSLALKGNDLYAWGNNAEGQLGDGTDSHNNTLTRVIFPHEQNNTLRVPDTGVMITPNKVKVYVGESLTLNAVVSPSNATNKNVSWSSSNTDIATVTSNGAVNGIRDGQAKIIAVTASGNSATCTVTVKEIKASSVKMDQIYVEIAVGESFALNASVLPVNMYNKNITWSSSNRTVAFVSSSGVVTGVKAGKATIKAKTVNGKTAKCVVTVLPN